MVDINQAEKKFSVQSPQSRARTVRDGARMLDLAARAGRQLEQALNQGLQEAGLSAAQGRALRAIAAEPELTVGQLTGRLDVSKQSLAPVLKALTARGLVTVAGTHADRRRRLLSLSREGEKLWEKAARAPLDLLATACAESCPDRTDGLEILMRQLAGIAEGNRREEAS